MKLSKSMRHATRIKETVGNHETMRTLTKISNTIKRNGVLEYSSEFKAALFIIRRIFFFHISLLGITFTIETICTYIYKLKQYMYIVKILQFVVEMHLPIKIVFSRHSGMAWQRGWAFTDVAMYICYVFVKFSQIAKLFTSCAVKRSMHAGLTISCQEFLDLRLFCQTLIDSSTAELNSAETMYQKLYNIYHIIMYRQQYYLSIFYEYLFPSFNQRASLN